MKKLILLSGIFFIALFTVNAQTGLIIKNADKALYLDHQVAAKEGLYSIGRLYNVNPKFLANYNKIDLNKGLEIGQVIHIPITDTNFTQKSSKGVPIYHIVSANETLTQVSNANRKVALQQLRTWNGLKSDNLTAGSNLIVGYLVSAGMTTAPALKPIAQETVKTEEKVAVKTNTPVNNPVTTTNTAKEQAESPKENQSLPVEQKATTQTNSVSNATEANSGYFKSSFELQAKTTPANKSSTVTSGIFRTVSGWQDAKYYMLIDGVPAGSIIRITNPGNNKEIYAKVLGEMNGIRQNQGLGIRISNAGASALGVADTEKFIVKLNY